MRGDTWASTCHVACSLAMPEDTSTSTCPSACLVFMHRDTWASACRFACADRRYCDTSCFYVSSCMELLASCTSTLCSCVDTQQVKLLTPRPDPLDQVTSSFSVDLRDFGPSDEFSSRDQS
ncbi:hypothetical protein F2Q69_00008075 [Brassica cretica]|uniref:Uncharacterized protein n=1 Tax=Brassica cretica TaxID=69181 RepID=A0A8S9PKG4_BRACR|nr:hypothetical protein F2Q69_00008075 [Brassica cretica]